MFFIADLHAVTEKYETRSLAGNTLTTAALYLACGIDPTRSTLFVQSHVAAHAQMARLLGSVCGTGMLQRMVQFKEKSQKEGEETASLSLLDYPVLMAADVLLYQAHVVPVGEDQTQHLELARELAKRINKRYGKKAPLFIVPQPLVVAEGARLMSLTDGTKKMSKSEPDDNSRINMMDDADTIRRKIRAAKTDLIRGLEFDNPERPEVHNLLGLYQLASGKSREEVARECADLGFGQFKPLLADALTAMLSPIQARYREILADETSLRAVLKQGAGKAAVQAKETLARVSEAMGFLLPG
jgi:tryptophanyl-tRNA synthetase